MGGTVTILSHAIPASPVAHARSPTHSARPYAALPGNGTTLATQIERKKLFLEAGTRIVDMCRAYYEGEDDSVLPRSIATKAAFENAMCLDVAMGGSTNTVLHILAIAHEAGVDFTLDDIDAISRRVPCLCKVAPNSTTYHIEHVHAERSEERR